MCFSYLEQKLPKNIKYLFNLYIPNAVSLYIISFFIFLWMNGNVLENAFALHVFFQYACFVFITYRFLCAFADLSSGKLYHITWVAYKRCFVNCITRHQQHIWLQILQIFLRNSKHKSTCSLIQVFKYFIMHRGKLLKVLSHSSEYKIFTQNIL